MAGPNPGPELSLPPTVRMGILRKHAAPLLAALLLCHSVGLHVAPAEHAEPAEPGQAASPHPAAPDAQAPLTEQLGADFATHITDHFVLAHAPDQAEWARRTGRLLESTHAEFRGTMQRAGFTLQPPPEKLTWIYFESRARFLDYARKADRLDMAWSEGYYSARTNRVALLPKAGRQPPEIRADRDPRGQRRGTPTESGRSLAEGVGVADGPGGRDAPAINLKRTRHEAAHQLAFNLGLQKRGVMYPLWVSEGLATSFEVGTDYPSLAGLDRDNPARRRRLIDAAAHGRLLPLSRFVSLASVQAADAPALRDLYAQSWGFFHFLLKHRRHALERYLAALRRAEPGWRNRQAMHREFLRHLGPIESLHLPWHRFLRRLRTVSLVHND